VISLPQGKEQNQEIFIIIVIRHLRVLLRYLLVVGIYSMVLLLLFYNSLFKSIITICFGYFKALVFPAFVYTSQSLIFTVFGCRNILFFQAMFSELRKYSLFKNK